MTKKLSPNGRNENMGGTQEKYGPQKKKKKKNHLSTFVPLKKKFWLCH